MNNMFFKILTSFEWAQFQETGEFKGSEMDKADGFIHLSFDHQRQRIQDKFFKDMSVVILTIDPNLMNQDLLKIEANRPGGDAYPHYYGALTLGMCVHVDGTTIR